MKEINEEILYFLRKYQIDNNLKGIYQFSKSLVSVGYRLKNTDTDTDTTNFNRYTDTDTLAHL